MERSYREVSRNLDETQLRSYELCENIRALMDLLYVNSFESIIADRIRTVCPNLKREGDKRKLVDNYKNNGYIDHLVFNLIFKGVIKEHWKSVKAEEIQIRQITDKLKNNNQTYYQLEHEGVCLTMANQEQILSTLKKTIIELISDNRINEIIDRYHRVFNSQEMNMHEVKHLSDLWNADNLELPEENYPVCDGCPPRPEVER
jgi:hypothetical protein